MGNPQAIHAIRNVCFAGHGGSGKTTLIEGILFHCKATTRLGSVDEGTSLSDYLAEEKDRRSSLNTAILHCENEGTEFHLIDTPGFPDFLGETISGLSAADAVVLTIAANEGLTSTARKLFRRCKDEGKPTGIVFTKMDAENIEYDALLQSVRESFGNACIPVTVPRDAGPGLKEVAVVVTPGEPSAGDEETSAWREKVIEAAVETDDVLLEKYLEGEEIPPGEIAKAIRVAVRGRKLIPVFATSVPKSVGLVELVGGLASFFQTPSESAVPALEGEGEVTASPDAPFAARIFKSVTDDYVGKLSFFRVYSGEMTTESSVLNPRLGKAERILNLFTMQGKEQTPVTKAVAGGIYAAAKVESLNVSDTLCTAKAKVQFSPITFPKPMVSLAVEPKSRQDEQRIGGSLGKLTEEDPTFLMKRDRQTKELVITGMSQLHLDLKLKQLKRRFNVEVNTRAPKVPYLETITAKGDEKYRHKKQTGGAGQFAEVWMRIEPLTNEQGLPEGFEYRSAVVGGHISQGFLPSIEKGVKQVLKEGPVAGYPVDGVLVEVYDGKEHPVDSKDIAFQIAGREVFKMAMEQAKPRLLEPIMDLEVTIPTRFMGDMTGDLNSRRGRIMGMNAEEGLQVITAKVPLAEMLTYSTELKSMTQDEGSYTLTLSHYEIVPDNVAQAVIRKSRERAQEESS